LGGVYHENTKAHTTTATKDATILTHNPGGYTTRIVCFAGKAYHGDIAGYEAVVALMRPMGNCHFNLGYLLNPDIG